MTEFLIQILIRSMCVGFTTHNQTLQRYTLFVYVFWLICHWNWIRVDNFLCNSLCAKYNSHVIVALARTPASMLSPFKSKYKKNIKTQFDWSIENSITKREKESKHLIWLEIFMRCPVLDANTANEPKKKTLIWFFY